MEPEILKKLEAIEGRIGAVENRLGKVEALSVATSQKIVATQMSKQVDVQNFQPKVEPSILPSMSSGGLESYFGRWILGVVGLLSIVFGVSYFLKYAFDNNWISETARVIIGLGAGLVFIVAGEFIRKSQEKYSYILSATGLGLLYLSTYAAYGYYELITAGTSFLFMTVVTTFGVILSVWTNSEILASLTAAMGFLVPYLFGLRAASDFGYFIYTLALNIGILSVSFFRKWRRLTILGFVGTILHFDSWSGLYYTLDKQYIAIYALVVFYLIYLVATVINKFITNEKSERALLIMLTLNPVWFFFELYDLLSPGSDATLALVAISLSVVYIILAYLFKVRRDDDQSFALFLGGIGALFLTIAVPIYFDKEIVTIAWAVEALIVAILAVTSPNDGLKKASLCIFTIALLHFFVFDDVVNLVVWSPIFNWKFLTYLVLILTGAVVAYLFGRFLNDKSESDMQALAVLWVVVNLLVFLSLTSEIWTYFDQARLRLGNELAEEASILSPLNSLDRDGVEDSYRIDSVRYDTYDNIENQRNVATSIFWTTYAIILISLGILMQNPLLRKSALALFVMTTLKVFVFDLAGLATLYRVVSFMILGLVLLIASYLYFRHQGSIESRT